MSAAVCATAAPAGPEKLLTMPEVAERLSIDLRSLRRWIARRIFPQPIRQGHRFVRVPESALNAWLSNLEAQAQAQAQRRGPRRAV